MAAGITQPGGGTSTIFYHSDAASPDAVAYHALDIANAFPAVFIPLNTSPAAYLSLATIQCGDATTDPSTTTFQDNDVTIFFAAGKTWQWRNTQTTSWITRLGAKVGSGNQATGRNGCNIYPGTTTTFRGQMFGYDTKFVTAGGAMSFTPASSGSNFELVDCMVGNRGTNSTSTIALGTSVVAMSNLFNVDLWSNINAGINAGILTALNASVAERLTVGGPNMGSFIRSAQASLNVRDIRFFGVPSLADIACTSSNPAWNIVNPKWSNNAPRFGPMTVPVGGIVEWWDYDSKAGDPSSGAVLAGMPVSIVDVLLNSGFSVTTDSEGRVVFGSGLTANALPVRDHYGTAANYLTRDRSPYTLTANSGAGRILAYSPKTYAFNWPGLDDGNFSAVNDILPVELTPPPVAITVDQVPLPAHGEVRFESVIPAIV